MMLIVPRHVREIEETVNSRVENSVLPLSGFREKGAWVLLGEPGAGKSEALKAEARETDGLYISIAEFLSDAPDSDWRGKILFLDALDETRAGGDDVSILFKLRSHLKKLGYPSFRIACRAADWFGSTDRQAIGGASPDGQLAVLVLEPLSEDQITEILQKNHGITSPQGFVEQAADRRLDGLLSNPQTLKLLAKAIRDGQWPRTLQDTYQLACRQSAGEDNIRQDNSDLFRFFWTETEPNSPKPENSCRDVLLDQLKSRLEPFGIDCLPEADHFNDKRADIRLSFRNAYELPIEIKRESNAALWTGLRSQLMEKYVIAPNAAGHGIYLVLWFARNGLPVATDGGKKPTSPAELQRRLQAQLNPEERRRIFVRVLDVSWPARST